jgi:hypothetical protein
MGLILGYNELSLTVCASAVDRLERNPDTGAHGWRLVRQK